MANKNHSYFSTGVTSNLRERIYQYKQKLIPGFVSQHEIEYLVYYEKFTDAVSAIVREKQIKGGSRKRQLELVRKINPSWKDLSTAL